MNRDLRLQSDVGQGRWKAAVAFQRIGGEAYSYEEYYLERLPVTAVDHALRTGVKKLINFKD